tara:strand:+ start:78 stop:788 length:711 start_codon:yes stop_codon:yes gene_type:complete
MRADGYSALCQVMWDAKISCEDNAARYLIGVGKDISFKNALLKNIPSIYYPDYADKIVFDKCRTWVNEPNIAMARQHISNNVKAVVMVRPMEEIMASFVRVASQNNRPPPYELLLDKDSGFLDVVRSTSSALKSQDPNFLFVSYDDLVADTNRTLDKIYKHIGVNRFIHNTQKIEQTVFEDDVRNNTIGMHTIRPKIAKKRNKIVLPDWAKAACEDITNTFFEPRLLESQNGNKTR